MTGHRTHKISKVMTTLSDMVMQCGGGGCCVLEQCFQYPRRAREPRDCGCQFALLHRADIAWPSVLANNLYFYYCLFFFFLFFLLLPLRPLSTSSSSSSSLRISCLSLSLSYSFSSQYCRDVPFVFLLLRCVLHSGSCAPLLHSPTESTFRRVIRSTILSIECRRIPPSIKSSRDSVDHNDSFTRRDSNFSIVRLIQRNERKPRIGEIFGLANFHRVGKGWTMDFVVLFELKRMDIREKSRNVEGNLDR